MTTRKLTRDEFSTALRRGRGKALMHVLAFGLDGIDDLVLEACLDNLAYDRQCEEQRAPWLYRMFKGSAQYASFASAILTVLNEDVDENRREQLCNLSALMARDGDAAAATTLRRVVWAQNVDEGFPLGSSAIVMLDGIPALVEMARRIGRILLDDPNAFIQSLDSLAEDANCYEQALAALKLLAPDDKPVAAYLQEHLNDLAQREIRKNKPLKLVQEEIRKRVGGTYTLEQVLAEAEAGESMRPHYFSLFGSCATRSELETVLQHLEEASASSTLIRLLSVFRKSAMPHLPPRIWALAEHDHERVRQRAFEALAQVKSPAVGEFARNRLRAGFPSSDAELLELFARNYLPGDVAIMITALDRLDPDIHDLHALGSSGLEVLKQAAKPELRDLAEWIYQKTPCSHCRNTSATWMAKYSVLSAEIVEECQFDAVRDTQAIGRGTITI